MSDVQSDVQSERITIAQAMAYLRDALPTPRCRMCDEDDVEPIIDHDRVHVSQIHLKAGVVAFFPVVAFVCNRCGYLTQFSWTSIKIRIDNQSDKSDA